MQNAKIQGNISYMDMNLKIKINLIFPINVVKDSLQKSSSFG